MKRIRLLVILSFIMGCLLMFACCGKASLDAPKDFRVDEASLVLTWNKVKGAKGYKIYVNGEEYNSTNPTYPLEPLNPGDYEITVKAISADAEVEDSELSKVYKYTRPVESGLVYSLINNNTEYEIRNLGSAVGHIVIEEEYRGKPVTKIAEMAFANKSKDVLSVTIKGEKMRTIGARAFYNCSLMASVEMPDTVTEIGGYAFYGCRSLTTVDLPDNLATINGYTFASCRSLATVEFPSSVTTIGTYAFSSCDVLDNVVIPDTVQTINDYAFAENIGLTKVTIGNGVKTIPEYAFLNCANLNTVNFGGSLETIKQYAFSGCVLLAQVDIPDTVETIELGAFINCLGLVSVDLPANLKSLGAGAFSNTLAGVMSLVDGIAVLDGWVIGYDPNALLVSEEDAWAGYDSCKLRRYRRPRVYAMRRKMGLLECRFANSRYGKIYR